VSLQCSPLPKVPVIERNRTQPPLQKGRKRLAKIALQCSFNLVFRDLHPHQLLRRTLETNSDETLGLEPQLPRCDPRQPLRASSSRAPLLNNGAGWLGSQEEMRWGTSPEPDSKEVLGTEQPLQCHSGAGLTPGARPPEYPQQLCH
jgi:hypothetical protein